MNPPPLPVQYLPEGLRTIADACGWDVMWKLWDNFAGGRLNVPKKPSDDNPIFLVLNSAESAVFCREFGGEILNIPKADAAKRAVRDQALRAERSAGMEINRLCLKYKLTYRQIQTICREDSPMPNNLSLFD
ncbi:MAG: hypothetical protein CTY18_06065 [Methylomonas sp.]|nr:MAG: hypothetical protein CTY24_11785 [Methylobacter sp.]PPD36039.1 MAG: hypothetical protein CTY18_06065 [Methylomonas sp.]